jgi:hypothetical protein
VACLDDFGADFILAGYFCAPLLYCLETIIKLSERLPFGVVGDILIWLFG